MTGALRGHWDPVVRLLPVTLTDLDAVRRWADLLAPVWRAGDVVTLQGDLGAGKTALARAILESLGVTGDVPSPTFTLMNVYETARFPVYHVDLYRLDTPESAEDIGLFDAAAHGFVILEWPQKAWAYLPAPRLDLMLSVRDDGGRDLVLATAGQGG